MPSVTRCRPLLTVLQLREPDTGTAFRCAYLAPTGHTRGTCVIVPSGHAGAYDEPGPERDLYDRLAASLATRGIGCVRFDLERRGDLSRPAGPEHVARRTARFLRVLREPRLQTALQRPALLGTSLGGRCVLQLLTANPPAVRPVGVVLVGCVVGEVVPVRTAVPAFHLVYGAEDHIALLYPDGSRSDPIPPARYAADAAKLLPLPDGRVPRVHILDGLGHTLEPARAEPGPDAVLTLAALIEEIYTLS